jgi:hypothetical protein
MILSAPKADPIVDFIFTNNLYLPSGFCNYLRNSWFILRLRWQYKCDEMEERTAQGFLRTTWRQAVATSTRQGMAVTLALILTLSRGRPGALRHCRVE